MYIVEKSKKIFGEVTLEGAKNAALPTIVAAGLTDEEVILRNIPLHLNDVQILINLLNEAGYNIEQNFEKKELHYKKRTKDLNYKVSKEGNKIRYSLLLLSLFLGKTGKCKVPTPGGCKIGERKYDIHLDALNAMGGNIVEGDEFFIGELNDKKFNGQDLTFHIATTSGTENAIIAGVFAKGKTRIKNANTRPEIIDMINFLNKLGAKIKYHTRYIEIEGVEALSGGEYTIMGGWDEAITYMILAGMTRGEIKISNFSFNPVKEDIALLKQIGLEIFEWGNDVYVSAKDKNLKPFSMATAPYPGINSDMQPLFAALATTIEGESIITDMRFTDRFQYVDEFKKMGIDIVNYHNCAIIQGGKKLNGTRVIATDLRGGAALVLLGSLANGKTEITNEYQIDRGYVNLQGKLTKLGCNLKKVN